MSLDFKRSKGLTEYTLVDDITFSAATKSSQGLTASAILGPFWREDHPVRPNGTTISFDTPDDAQVAFMHGRVTDVKTGKPIAGATVDIWQASTNGRFVGSRFRNDRSLSPPQGCTNNKTQNSAT
jgi:protocatechuate 3,4-dioxygenase beta subunit